MLGGHDIIHQHGLLAKPWQCRICHRTAAKRASLCYSRCSGSAVQRWSRAAGAAARAGGRTCSGHCLLLTGTVVWCWNCGANACVRARRLATPCRGRTRGFLVQTRQRLLLGLHPNSRLPLGAPTVPEPGRTLPVGFTMAVQAAEVSRTSTARCGTFSPCSARRRLSKELSPRLEALRSRVLAKEGMAKTPARPLKRRRLRAKQPPSCRSCALIGLGASASDACVALA